jgi:cobalamin biosynthesis protein CbiG
VIAVIAFTRRGCVLGKKLAQAFGGKLWTPERFAAEFEATSYDSLAQWTQEQFAQGNGMVFVSATGIAVRAIAPYVRDKFTDPPVVSVDECGRYAVPLLSGHVGGANDLARQVTAITDGVAVISTATDVNGRFAVDVWAKQNHLYLVERSLAKEVSAALLDGTPVGFASDIPYEGSLPCGLEEQNGELGIYVGSNVEAQPFSRTLHLLPQDLIVGVGCKRGTSSEALEAQILRVLKDQDLPLERVACVATIDLKAEEPGLRALCKAHRWPMHCFSADQLSRVPGVFTPSEFVSSVTGVDNVCERAAVCAGGTLLTKKNAQNGVTVALAQRPVHISF